MSGEASIYVHIPFCQRKCPYCHFFVLPNKPEQHPLLVQALIKEWKLQQQLLSSSRLVSLYFGGGTPSLLGPNAIAQLIESIAPPTTAEITLEANPEEVTVETMRQFASVGVNRVSLGVQSLDDQLLKTLGRQHSAGQAIQAVEAVVTAGISNVTIDLMYELPGQTLERWNQTLDLATPLPIAHLSLYNLTIEPHTIYYKKRNELTPQLPSAEEGAAMYQEAIHRFSAMGLEQYELSAFAKPGRQSRHNIGYWLGRPYLGLGPSAHSFWQSRRWKNIEHLGHYLKSIQQDTLPRIADEELTPEARQRELLAIRLRLLEGVDLSDWNLAPETLAALERLASSELLERRGSHWKLSSKGLLFYDTVAVELI